MAAHVEDQAPEASAEHHIETNVLEPGEPQTPGWLPVLGCALFIAAGILGLATCGGTETSPPGAAASASASAAPQAAE